MDPRQQPLAQLEYEYGRFYARWTSWMTGYKFKKLDDMHVLEALRSLISRLAQTPPRMPFGPLKMNVPA